MVLALLLLSVPFPPEAQKKAEALENDAAALQDAGKYADAETPLREALALRQKFEPKHHDTQRTRMNLAVAVRRAGRTKEAITLLQSVLAASAKSREPNMRALHQATLHNLASAQWQNGQLAEARKSFEGLAKETPPNTEDRALALDSLANVLVELGEPKAALPRVEEGYAIWKKLRGEEHRDTLISLTALANVTMELGSYADARKKFEKAATTAERVFGAEHPQTGAVYNLLGVACYRAGDRDAARAHLQRAVAIDEKALPPGHPQTADAKNNLKVVN